MIDFSLSDEEVLAAVQDPGQCATEQAGFTGRGLSVLLDPSRKQLWRERWFSQWIRLGPASKEIRNGEAGAYACKLRMGIDDMVQISAAVSGQLSRLEKSMQSVSTALADLYINDTLRLDAMGGLIANAGSTLIE